MKTYVWVSFAFMGWAYYEMSGGNDFVPEQPTVATAQTEATAAPEVVTRAANPALLRVSASTAADGADEIAPIEEARVVQTAAVTETVAPVEETVVEVAAPAPQAAVDIREVAGSRVNMRTGPGTNFDVIVTLDGGTALEVIEVDASGWANVATLDDGFEGWMAERLLTSPDA